MKKNRRERLREALRLYAVTDRHWLGERKLSEVVRESLEGGVTFLQLREKTYAATDLLSGSTTELTLKADAAVGVVVPARNAVIYKLK